MQRSATLIVDTTLQTNGAPAPRDLHTKVTACIMTEGRVKVPSINLEISGDPVHLKRRVLPYARASLGPAQ